MVALPTMVRELLPPGAISLAALHDVGKISCGFQVKCPAWLVANDLVETALRERWNSSESDHAKISQFFLQRVMKPEGTSLWGVAAGVHHGRIFGRQIRTPPNVVAPRESWETQAREALLDELVEIFGPLPVQPPVEAQADLWCVAGLISVADWIGSNEVFFPSDRGLSLDESRCAAGAALRQIGWGGGKFRPGEFGDLFGGYEPAALQRILHEQCAKPGLFIVEGPMGCGKTEAALWAAHRLIRAEANDGIYFALPTQVTSNRIHRRVAPFLANALEDATTLRLAHGASWLEDCQTLVLHPAAQADPAAQEHVREGRSWFASAKHALLARFGVGTVDQALQGVVAVKHFFVRRFGLAGKVVILDEVHSYDVYTGTLISCLIRELLALHCSVIVLSATLTRERRQELVRSAATGEAPRRASSAYPLVTVVRAGEDVREFPVAPGPSRLLKLKTTAFAESKILEECLERAEGGQHVLYLRNTVVEAQEICRAIKGSIRADRAEVGLLHSRFPFFRRQQLEDFWLSRLGKQRAQDGRGSVLIATQVVEQSVDIDLDFIVTDLAPTDMLLQRMGRLWRHERADRLAPDPEFWINTPLQNPGASARELKAAFGKTGRVYAPYVLLRTAEVFADRKAIVLPDQIREVLEATYAERSDSDEPIAWRELQADLMEDRETQAALAESATKVFGQQSQQDAEGLLTRRKGAPTRDVTLLEGCELLSPGRWRLTPLEGEPIEVSGYKWRLESARMLARHLVRAPRYAVPPQETPPWLSLHVQGGASWALVPRGGGPCVFPGAEGDYALAYSPMLGLNIPLGEPQPRYIEVDDEFDY